MTHKKKSPTTDLIRAVQFRDIVAIQSLVNAGVSVHKRTLQGNLVHLAVKALKILTPFVPYTLDQIITDTQLVLEILLSKGADVNEQDSGGNTPLHYTFHLAIAEMLLAYGASPHIKNQNGETPLHTVAYRNKLIIELLLNKGVSPHVKDKIGNTPLHAAAQFASDPLVIECLINKGLLVSTKNRIGETSLGVAVKFLNNISVIEKLLSAQSNIVNTQDKKGQTLFTRVLKFSRRKLGRESVVSNGEVIRLLLSHGAYSLPIAQSIDSGSAHIVPITDEFLVSNQWSYPLPYIEVNKCFYIALLLAGFKPGYGYQLPFNLEPIVSAIENTIKLWLSQRIFKKESDQINWQEVTPKVLNALPRLLHFIKRLTSTTAPSLQAGYTSNNLRPFLFIPDQKHNSESLVERLDWFTFKGLYPNPLLVLKAIAAKQLPVELITIIRDCLADWAMIDILISDYNFDQSIAEPFLLDVRENPKEYTTFHRQLLTHDWPKPFLGFNLMSDRLS